MSSLLKIPSRTFIPEEIRIWTGSIYKTSPRLKKSIISIKPWNINLLLVNPRMVHSYRYCPDLRVFWMESCPTFQQKRAYSIHEIQFFPKWVLWSRKKSWGSVDLPAPFFQIIPKTPSFTWNLMSLSAQNTDSSSTPIGFIFRRIFRFLNGAWIIFSYSNLLRWWIALPSNPILSA